MVRTSPPAGAFRIRDIGYAFNRELGSTTHRVAVFTDQDTSADLAYATTRANVIKLAQSPNTAARICIQDDCYWYDNEIAPEALADEIVRRVKDADVVAIRRGDRRDVVARVGICCIIDRDAAKCTNGWLFRHDAIDGFRFTRQLLRTSFVRSPMVIERLLARVTWKHHVLYRLKEACAWATLLCRLPALAKLLDLAPRAADARTPFYRHISCELEELRAGVSRETPGGAAGFGVVIVARRCFFFFVFFAFCFAFFAFTAARETACRRALPPDRRRCRTN